METKETSGESSQKENIYEQISLKIAKLVTEKNAAYGDSFAQSYKILEVLYPRGIKPEQYLDMLATIRIIDKLFRLANNKSYNGESPWNDILGYGILGAANEYKNNKR